jgi:energy-converting hydrogenase Eha subunit A
MNTAAATLESPSTANVIGRYLYFGTALLLGALVYLAFTRTFWSPLASGSLALHPAIIVHAALFFLWTGFFVVQTWLPLAGRTALHRDLGMFGIALAAMMVFAGLLAAIVSIKAGLAGPRPEIARTATVLSFSGMTLFSTFIVLALANIRRPDFHKRLMLLATFSILQAAVARVIMLVPAIAQPQRVVIGAVIVDAMIVAVALLDARDRGRVHPVYVAGGAFIVGVQYLRAQLLGTDGWVHFCTWLAALGT